jgi:hypothetical protein
MPLVSGLALLVLVPGLHGETILDFSLDTAVSGGEFTPSLAAGIETTAQRLGDRGPSLYFDFSADASRDLLDSGYSGQAEAELAAYTLFGRTNLGLKLETVGVLPSSSIAGSAVAALSLPVTLNGPTLSFSIMPTLSIDPLDSGYESFGLASSLSIMAGSFVLKPGFGFSIIRPWNGGIAYALKPGMEIAWYPGFPVSLALSGEYRINREDPAADAADAVGFDCVGVAAPSGRILLTLTAEGYYSSSSTNTTVSLETAFTFARSESGREWSLPVQIGYIGVDDRRSLSFGLGVRLSF